ncbi:putative flippase GtrA [Paenibacillus endophyticus]|uniref:Putative flippase GtrA n=1 Tax=Paenibacillus endophyticus TaxID=1294268 RepID=A0A7W5C685_9BACL|nr:putative flippase GtrA [Paenibacillus endophyticus]
MNTTEKSFVNKIMIIIKFGFIGALNTAFTYLLYLVLLNFFSYSIAYSISYIVGIVFSYFFNSYFVFKIPVSLSNFLRFPIVYVVQYFLNLLLIFVLVDKLLISEQIALLISIVVTFPISFVLSRYVLKGKKNK